MTGSGQAPVEVVRIGHAEGRVVDPRVVDAVEGIAGPSGEVTIALTAPEKPGRYQLELEADPDGATGIGPLRSSPTLEVISISKAPVKQP